MDNIAEIAVQCRLCGLYFCHQNPMSIFSSDVLSKLKDLTGLELHEEEHQPRHICSTCLNELKVSIKFKERILRSRQILVPTTEDTIDQDLESEISNKDKRVSHVIWKTQMMKWIL
ncbi:uncharacterized protein LOC108111547 [Drosophila eugracilis]|uniref:uncharacterized protein LOC108111547 n=1 Tax=Drosophila eugracilis TaxID=29029 RepID=UPI001BDA49EC|nr:uncharacterized protein LOC108111547 [Drosophila eugracilis]